MIGMNFSSFVVLLVASGVAAAIMQYAIRYRYLQGVDGFLAKWVVAWMGAWLGSPVLGHWWESVKLADIYLVPALLGAFAGSFLTTAFWKSVAQARALREAAPAAKPGEMPRTA